MYCTAIGMFVCVVLCPKLFFGELFLQENRLGHAPVFKKKMNISVDNESFCCADAWTTKMLIVKKNCRPHE